jgi:hypothetical protein
MPTGLIPEFGLEIVNLYAPPGTRLVMQQNTAPLGWTVDASSTYTDCSMRFNQSVTSGGATNWSSWNFGGSFNLNAFTIGVSQLPAHNHGVSDPTHAHGTSDPTHTHSDGGHQHGAASGQFWTTNPQDTISQGSGGAAAHAYSNTATGFASINAAFTGVGVSAAATGITTTNTGSGSTITPTYTTPQVKFADCIVAIKS